MFADLLFRLYGIKSNRLRAFIRWLVCRMEGGEPYSATLRRIFSTYYSVDIGMYSMGCFGEYQLYRGTSVGRYCSITPTAKTITAYHPIRNKSTHPFFYHPDYGLCEKHALAVSPITIGNDVWIGEYAVILPSTGSVGDGAVIGANAVVNKEVPPYAIVVGNPARVVGYRFPPDVIDQLLTSRWWEKDIEELRPSLAEFLNSYTGSQNI